ncbi:flowering time control protein FCA-like [Chenopodium quinoa]|uniref:flowering time control protein FCA-like n=1 Tax=Chenopodium quinoa TaxID=63459 RepID=UPI000B785FF1|nr:flowering time control protein FCA-like [Chenopodium quinoa]
MESHPPPFNPNPWDPLPPPPPPPNFQWGNPGFPGDGFPQFQPFHPPPDHSFAAAGGGFCQPPPQPQPKPHFQRKRKFDRVDDGSFVKLYVGGIPRTVTQDEIFCLFQEHGNVVEVVLLPDKWTGQQQDYCFVKYAFTEEADRAIIALNNQFTFPEAMAPIRVRYADGARQRQGLERPVQHDSCLARPGLVQNDSAFSGPAIVGQTLHKLYVNGFNREASKREIEEIFSTYGVVADVYLLRDESKQSRGCGFVGFTQRHMAEAAISALNGTYVMKGCDCPLAVRFAEPKKPKNGELRPIPNPVDMRGSNKSNALHLGNSSNSMQVNITGIQGGSFPTVGNRLECPANEMQKPLHKPISPSRFSQMSLQHSQSLNGSPQPSRQTESQLSTPLHSNQKSNNSIEQQNDDQSPQTCRDTGSNSVMLISEPASCPSRSDLSENPIDCDWSEHICPDGCKYYFNCVTCESRWEKPEEFALYEQQLKGMQVQKHSCQEPLSALEASSVEEDCQIQAAPDQKEPCDFEKPQLTMSCSVEHGHEQVQAETSALGGPSFVQ